MDDPIQDPTGQEGPPTGSKAPAQAMTPRGSGHRGGATAAFGAGAVAPGDRPPDLAGLLEQVGTPIWVFGFSSHRILWANRAALEVWKADSLAGLRLRNMSPVSPAARDRLAHYAATFASGNAVCEDWTLFPKDEPVDLHCVCQGITWDGEPAMLVEAQLRGPDAVPQGRSAAPSSEPAPEGTGALFACAGPFPTAARSGSDCGDTTPAPGSASASASPADSHDAAKRAVEVLRGVPIAVLLLLADGTVVSRNLAAELAFGVLDDGTFADAFIYRADHRRLLEDALAKGEAQPRMVPINTRSDVGWFEIGARRLRDPATAAPAVLIHAIDVTDRRLQEDALRESETQLRSLARDLEQARDTAERANAAKSDFLAMISHEIRTPMNGVLGLTDQLLGADPPPTPDQTGRLLAIRDSAEALLSVINDVLDFSRLEAGRLDLEIQPFRLRTVFEGSLNLLRPGAEKKGLTLSLSQASGLPVLVRGDPGRLRQILINIIGNAVKFTDRGGVTVTVCAGTRQDEIRVTVTDTGIGIAPDVLPRLFTSYTQADTSISRRFGGSGLGLVISRRLAGLMEGAITVHSVPGEGSEFTITVVLPAASAREARALATQESQAIGLPRRASGAPYAILIAEDNAINCTVLEGYLVPQGVDLDIAVTGVEAVEKAAARAFDVILMDMRMPGMEGPAAARAIRASGGPSAAAPIIAVTANAFADDRETCLAAGMTDFLAKPVRRDALFQALNTALGAEGAAPAGQPRPDPTAATPAASALHDLGASEATAPGAGSVPAPETSPVPAVSDRPHGAQSAPSPDDPQQPSAFAMTDPDSLPTTPASAPMPPVLDDAHLTELDEDLGAEIIAGMARQFIAAGPDRLARIAETLDRASAADAGREAHSLKGVAATLGLERVRRLAADVDLACRAGDIAQARTLARDLPEAMAETRQALADRYALPVEDT